MSLVQSIKIVKLIVKNYRGIGPSGLEIDIDDIVVLVGPNNCGKSTILKAFELVTTPNTKINIDDYHNKKEENKPEIEIWSQVLDAANVTIDSKKWVSTENIVKEKWVWEKPNESAERIGFRTDIDGGRWATTGEDPHAPFSNDGAAVSYRPSPTYISPFEQPEKQVEEIKKIISLDVYDSIKKEKKGDPIYRNLEEQITTLQASIKSEAATKEKALADELGTILNEVFSDTQITLHVPQNNPDLLSSYAKPNDIDFRINDLSLENQGSGMLRVLLWSVLKMLAGKQKNAAPKVKKTTKKAAEVASPELIADLPQRTKILLMDEPEICLHPESIRLAKEILYSLASAGEWQIMITTHSPIFIDLSKNNTNIIRVQKDEEKVSLFKTNETDLSADEKEQLKMLNIFDPYFAEFFFAKNTIVVEGDTEYTAFRRIIDSNKEKYKDIQIVRARGKYTIIPIIKILKKWGKNFAILHDSDKEDNKQSWPANKQILDLISDDASTQIKLIACKNNFESAFFGNEVIKDKPFNAYKRIEDETIAAKVTQLLDYLCGNDQWLNDDITDCVIQYKSIDELKVFIKS